MRKKKPLLFWSLIALPLLTCLLCASLVVLRGNPYDTLEVDGLERGYILQLPSDYDGQTPHPLVFVFHGGGGQARNMPNFTKFNDIADRENFIAVYPNGLDKGWSDGREFDPERAEIDDVRFIETLLDHLEASYAIDTDRVYTTGISNGGFFSQRLLCEMGDRFSAGVIITATLSENLYARCAPAKPVSIMYINGTADPLVPYDGGQVMSDRGAILSTDESVAWWVEANGCDTEPAEVTAKNDDPDDETSVIRTEYAGCDAESSVVLVSIVGGGHTWPGGVQYLPDRWVGVVSRELNASETAWQFFNE